MNSSSAWTVKTDWRAGTQAAAPAASPRRTWSPPPQPGVIPKRPLGFFETMDGGFRVLRAYPAATFGLAAILVSLAAVASLAVGAFLLWLYADLLYTLDSVSADAETGLLFVIEIAAIASSVITVPATQLFAGFSAPAARKAFNGEPFTFKNMWAASRGVRWKLIFATVLLVIGQLLITVVCFAVPVLLAVFADAMLAVAAFLIALLFFCLLTIFYVFKTSFTGPAIAYERLGVFTGLKRSWVLTGGQFWRVLGEELIAYFISSQLVQILAGPLVFFVWILFGFGILLFGESSGEELVIVIMAIAGLLVVAAAVSGIALLYAYWGTFTAVVYFDQRIRTEGYDLVMLREAESAAQPEGITRR